MFVSAIFGFRVLKRAFAFGFFFFVFFFFFVGVLLASVYSFSLFICFVLHPHYSYVELFLSLDKNHHWVDNTHTHTCMRIIIIRYMVQNVVTNATNFQEKSGKKFEYFYFISHTLAVFHLEANEATLTEPRVVKIFQFVRNFEREVASEANWRPFFAPLFWNWKNLFRRRAMNFLWKFKKKNIKISPTKCHK